MYGKYFENKVKFLLNSSSHPNDELLKKLATNFRSYYVFFDDVFGEKDIQYGEKGNYLFVDKKEIQMPKKIEAKEEWMAKEMLYKVRNIL